MNGAVIIGGGLTADALLAGLEALSWSGAHVDHPVMPDDLAAVTRSVAAAHADLGAPGIFIIPIVAEPADDLDDLSSWQTACERPLRRARIALQAARAALAGGGAIVFVVPSGGLDGRGGGIASCAVAEGVRALGKSAALAWQSAGIVVTFVAVTEDDLRNADRLRDDVAPIVAFLARAGTIVTGSTLVATGGRLMSP